MRHALRHAAMFFVQGKDAQREDVFRNRKQRPKKQNKIDAVYQAERSPARAAWEQSWARVRAQRPNFHDRVKVWQAIVELKRAGRQGKTGITNCEAWTALCDAAGSTSVAATFLSSEDYILGRRLQEQRQRIPRFLSLHRAAFNGNTRFSLCQGASCARETSEINYAQRGPTGEVPEMGDIFECVSTLFYPCSVSRAMTADAKNKKTQHSM